MTAGPATGIGSKQRRGFVLTIRPQHVEDYVEAHLNPWAELREAFTRSGIRNFSMFLWGNHAFGYFEADDVDEAWRRMQGEEVNVRWQLAMSTLLDPRDVERGHPEVLAQILRHG
jgi:L-rhamnose mutarotase